MSAQKSSAVGDEPIDVLVALQPKFDLLDLAGPVEAFTTALHDFKDLSKFQISLCPVSVSLRVPIRIPLPHYMYSYHCNA